MITPEVIEARIRAGYRPPQENPLICKNCGAIRDRKEFSYERYYCLRHSFYVKFARLLPILLKGAVRAARRAEAVTIQTTAATLGKQCTKKITLP